MNELLGIACRCGTVRGQVAAAAHDNSNHLVCYCRDCQAFARFVGATGTMDAQGGTEIVQVSCADVTLTEGHAAVACVQLRDGGLSRFYATCCNTPLGNSPGPALPFIGLIHDGLQPSAAIEKTFGPITMVAFNQGAIGSEKPPARGFVTGLVRFAWLALRARLRGDGQRHPFFNPSGEPLVLPKVLSDAEREPLYPV